MTQTREPTRPPRRVVSFVRRSSRMRGAQQRAWDEHRDRYLVPVTRTDTSTSVAPGQRLDPAALFGRDAPLIVEIGSGGGEVLTVEAARRPESNLIAFEVHEPSLANAVRLLSEAGIDNVRLVEADAVAGLEHLLGPGSIEELWTYFPDPWPKARHHKRRLVSEEFADLAASRLRPGGCWRLATDWADYADQMRAVLDVHPDFAAEPVLTQQAHPFGASAPDPSGANETKGCAWVREGARTRPLTRFERRGLEAGREITDLGYRRR